VLEAIKIPPCSSSRSPPTHPAAQSAPTSHVIRASLLIFSPPFGMDAIAMSARLCRTARLVTCIGASMTWVGEKSVRGRAP
jgi:hypothetical protein